MRNPQVVTILKRIDGHPVMVISDDVAALDTCINPSGLVVGVTVVLRNGKEFNVRGTVPEITGTLFPIWLA